MIKEKEVLVNVCELEKYYYNNGLIRNKQWILKQLSFCIYRGECLGIVGESSSGKSTISRILAGIEEPSLGRVYYKEFKSGKANKILYRGEIQMIFQDTVSSLNPRMKVKDLICEPLHILKKNKKEIKENLYKLIEIVKLDDELMERYPHELSGGQRQRVCIARAVSTSPQFLICDEAVSALDVSVQSKIIDLLLELKQKMRVTLLFVSHDLGVVQAISDRIMVLYEGRNVEIGNSDEIYKNPMHPYTKMLLNRNYMYKAEESISDFNQTNEGCPYYKYCEIKNNKCKTNFPKYKDLGNGHLVACNNL